MSSNIPAEPAVSAVHFDSLERDFVEVMRELSAEDSLERFRLEYEKLHRALKKSHESEKRLIKRCQEMNREIVENAVKIQQALKLSQDDENTIISLRKEIERAWKTVDAEHERENASKDQLQLLQKEVNRLKSEVEAGAGATVGQEGTLQELIEEKRALAQQKEAVQQRVSQQSSELQELKDRTGSLESSLSTKEADIANRTLAYHKLLKEHEEELRKKQLAESKVQDNHRTIEERSREIEALKQNIKVRTEEAEKYEKMLKDEREKAMEQQLRSDKVNRELQQQVAMVEQTQEQTFQQSRFIPKVEQKLEARRNELNAEKNKLERLQHALKSQEDEVAQAIRERDEEASKAQPIEDEIAALNSEIDTLKRKIEEGERKVKDAHREKNLNVTLAVREEHKRVELDGQRTIEYGKNRSLEHELDAHRDENQVLRKQIFDLSKQKQKYQQRWADATDRFNEALDHVDVSKNRIAQLEEELAGIESQKKKKAAMYDQKVTERNECAKKFGVAQGEIGELKRKIDMMDLHIDQLRRDLEKRESELCKAHAMYDTTQSELKTTEDRVSDLVQKVATEKQRGVALADEIKQLGQIIADCDAEESKQQMKFNSVTNERNILATQLIRRNEELDLLYEKIRIQQSTLGKGEAQYRERLVDINMLRRKVQDLRNNLKTSLARIKFVEGMKRQITALQRQLIQERMKVKALFEELQTPMNVHRWRRLEGSDPQEYDNIMKLQTLEQRVIAKTQESKSKEQLIRSKEKQYQDLKAVLARQPGPEIAEQLTVFYQQIQRREEQLGRMGEELQNNQSASDEYKTEVDRLEVEIAELKQKFFNVKSSNTNLKRERQLAVSMDRARQTGERPTQSGFSVRHPSNQQRFAAGGFSLSRY